MDIYMCFSGFALFQWQRRILSECMYSPRSFSALLQKQDILFNAKGSNSASFETAIKFIQELSPFVQQPSHIVMCYFVNDFVIEY